MNYLLMEHYKTDTISDRSVRNKTLTGLFFLLLFLGGAVFAWHKLQQQPKDSEALTPLRKGLDADEWVFSHLFSNNHMAKVYDRSLAVARVRVNGAIGNTNDADTAIWRLHLVRKAGDTLLISLREIMALPKTDVIFDFKCIEGWSQVTHWSGVRFSDFAQHYGLGAQVQMGYAGLVTPDQKYYVGIDMPSMMQPQTILCYEMNGALLPMNQGYPLRLIIPVKYGVKHLKRIGTLYFDNARPRDYWYEQGYDYYCGL